MFNTNKTCTNTKVYKGVEPKVFTEAGIRNSIQVSPTCNNVPVECSAGRINNEASIFVCIGSAATNGLIQGIRSLVLDIIVFLTPLPVV